MPRSPSPERRDRDRDRSSRKDLEYDSFDEYDRRAGSSRRREHDDAGRRDRHRDRDRDRDEDPERRRAKEARRRERERERSRSRERERDKDKDRRRDGEKSRFKRERKRDSASPDSDARAKTKRKEARQLAKAEVRRQTELEQSRALAELTMYSAQDNPFHDANLGEQFQWHKKREKEKKAGLTTEEIARKDARRRLEAKEELEKLNRRRADREQELALREEEENKLKRLAEDAAMAEWIAKEDDFQLEQARRRAGIRLREQRAKAIDFLAINLRFADARSVGRHTAAIGSLTNPRKGEAERDEEEEGWGWADAGFEFEIEEPWKIFDNLNLEDCIELEQDIKMYLSLEKSPINVEFWEVLFVSALSGVPAEGQAMLDVCTSHLEDLNDPDHAEGGRLFDRDTHEAAGKIVSGLSLARLDELERKTNAMLRSGQPVDGEFWDLVLKKIYVEKAIAKLNSIHEVVLKNRLEQFKKRQREEAAAQQLAQSAMRSSRVDDHVSDVESDFDDDLADDEGAADEGDVVEVYDREMSPQAVDVEDMTLEEKNLPVIEEEDEQRAIYAARRALVASSLAAKPAPTAQPQDHPAIAPAHRPTAADLEVEAFFRAEAQREKQELGSDESEEEFGDLDDGLEQPTQGREGAAYDLNDRYRPRKPRFFNRVHTGFEWTKYNQTHYDTDNPPPKVVQGYKFNIFYPDLIDKSKAPTYYTKPIEQDPETQMLVFQAGPPYEDVAFQIVKGPWEYSHRRGFRSLFDRGVLQLYFNFSKQFYHS